MKRRLIYGGMILLECALWGLGNPLIKITGQMLGPFTAIALRFLLALLVYALLFGRRVIANLRSVQWRHMLPICVCTALAFILGSCALLLTDAVIAGFLMGIAVLFTPFLEPLLLKTRFQWRIVPVVLVVCVGMYLLCGGGAFTFGAGELLAVLCSLAFALMLVLSEKNIRGMDTITLSTMQCAVAAAFGILCALLFERRNGIAAVSWQGAAAIGYLALGSTVLAYVLQNKAMRHISATYASFAFSTEPIFTAIFSYILLGERLPPMGVVGAGIIMVCILYASMNKT